MTEQPMPTRNHRPAVQDRVIDDIRRRKEIGYQRYGTFLTTFNGRDAARDLYEEQVDGLQYFRQLLDEWAVIQPVVTAAVEWQEATNAQASADALAHLSAAVGMLRHARDGGHA